MARILAVSTDEWGPGGRDRYSRLLTAAMLKVADNPEDPVARDRGDLASGVLSLHLRHVRADEPDAKVRRPVHVLYYRVVRPGVVEIVRVLHERMEPGRHFGGSSRD
jgi:toxin ParE1/3/4